MRYLLFAMCLTLTVSGCVTTEVNKPAPLVNYAPVVLAQKSPEQLKQDLKAFFAKADLLRRAPYRGADATWYEGDWAVTSFGVDGVFMKFKNAAPNYAYQPNNPDPTHTYGFYYDELASVAFNAGTCDTKTAPLPHGMTMHFYAAIWMSDLRMWSINQLRSNARISWVTR